VETRPTPPEKSKDDDAIRRRSRTHLSTLLAFLSVFATTARMADRVGKGGGHFGGKTRSPRQSERKKRRHQIVRATHQKQARRRKLEKRKRRRKQKNNANR